MFCLNLNKYVYLAKSYNFNYFFISNNKINYNSFYFLFSFFSNNVFASKITSTQNITFKLNQNYLFKYNKKYYYSFNKYNKFYFKKIYNIFCNLFLNNFNGLVLDSNYKTILPLYNYIYGEKSLYNNKHFFFFNKKNITRNNWMYLYLNNLKRFKINLLVVLDYFYFKNFLTILKKFNTPIVSLIPSKIEPIYIDYYIIINIINLEVSKFFMFNFFSNLFFKFNKNFLLKYKSIYLNKYFLLSLKTPT